MSFNIYSIYRKIQPFFRGKRMRLFLDELRPAAATRILDLGGHIADWHGVVPIESQITVLNIEPADDKIIPEPRFRYEQGDARSLNHPDQSFDIVYSNSVIEHLGTFEDQRRFAAEALRVGRSVYIQTPNRWFPIEPHFLTLLVHWLPKRLQRPLIRFCSFRALFRSGDNVDPTELFEDLRLLTCGEMKRIFPGCTIHREKVCGLTKSFTAIRRS